MSLKNHDAIVIESNDSMAVEMIEKEFRICILKMIREAKDEIREQTQAMHDHSSKQLKEQMQEAKEHFNKEIQILKKLKKKQKYLK